jgi:hypothetical protein
MRVEIDDLRIAMAEVKAQLDQITARVDALLALKSAED